MGLGEELLADYVFEITEARDRYEESIEREYEFYENVKKVFGQMLMVIK